MTVRPSHRVLAHRRRPLPILAFIVAAVAAFLMPAVRPDPVDAQATLNSQATLTVLSAPVEVQRASGNRDTASSGDTLVVGDRVFTGSGGTAKLTFFQGTEVDIAPETELMVQEMTQRQSGASTVSFGQAVGSTVAKVASLFNPASRVQVSTQSAVAVVRGTELEITVTKENVQVFRSNTGSFDVIAGGQTQRVKDGEVTVVPPPPPAPSAPPTTRDTQSIGNATISLPSGNDRPPLPPVPVAEINKLFEKVSEITAKDGPRVVVTPPVAARDLIDVAQGKPVVLRPLGESARPPTAVPAPVRSLIATPEVAKLPTPAPKPVATPIPSQSSDSTNSSTPPSSTRACNAPASTATPTSSQFGFAGQVVDGSGVPLGCAEVAVSEYEGTSYGKTYSDASGTFRVFFATPTSGVSTGTFVFSATDARHTQQVIPFMTATAGQLATLSSNVTLLTNDSTLTGAIWSGASATPASGAVASVAVAVAPPARSSSTLSIHVAKSTVVASGSYNLSLASGTYSYFVASQENVAPYAYRLVQATMPTVLPSPSTNSPIDAVLPTLDVSSAKTCQRYGASCSITLAGKGWTSSGTVSISAIDSTGTPYAFGGVTPTNGDFTSQVLTSSTSQWPTGSYTIHASQGSSERYVKLSDIYVVVDTTAPTVTGVTTSSSGTKRAGETVAITVTFSKPITTTGSPTLLLETGTTDTAATCTPVTTASTTLACTYTVVSSDASSRLDYQSTSALSGTIRDVAGNAATLTLPALGSSGLYSAKVAVDALAPTITAVTTTANGTKSVGDTVTIVVVFSEAITTTATSSLSLETGTTDTPATCPAVTASTTLTCTYAVALGDSSTHLDYVATNSLTTSGTVRDAAGNDAVRTLPATGTTGLYSAFIIVTGTCGTDRASAVTGSVTVSGQVTDAQSTGVAYACVQVRSYNETVSGYPVTKHVASDATGNYTATFNASAGIF